ncbi:siroheme synthase CysG [Occallatibacter savannae]|uniref:siroheme synthase CysG n=1 Tax=Occallatibacter savannae TaxID=1002691 RepID=UPI000D6935FA|nr:siroheme synthase CysG [Occallatibacter savannae]
MNLQPVFLKLAGRPGLLVGAGNVALEKLNTLLSSGVRLRVIAPEVKAEIRALAAEGKIVLVERKFTPDDLEGNFVVIAATDDPEVNATVYRESVERGILVNSVDDPPHCDFYFGSVVRRGDLQVAISTAGESPSVAQQLRREIDERLPEDLGPWLLEIGRLRREILATHPAGEERKALLHRIAKRRILQPERRVAGTQAGTANVFLVGAGPGDPDLLTVKAQRLIERADVILHDDLVTPDILALARPHAEIVNVGKRCGMKNITQEEINSLLVSYSADHRIVVRLKSGDPLIFGRAAEEMTALGEAGIQFEVVPGITAAFAAAAAIPCSLTDRHAASNVIFSTGHHAKSHNEAAIPEREDATRIVYMPGRDLTLLALEWLHEGLPAEFPCAIVSHAARPEQQVQRTTLGELGKARATSSPSLLIAGWALQESPDSALVHVANRELQG